MADTIEFDHQLSMKEYMKHVWEHFDKDSDHSDAVIKRTIHLIKTGKTHLNRNYEVYAFTGRDVLMEKRNTILNPVVQVLSYEDVFTIFMKHHIENDHEGGSHYLLLIERDKYKFPELCLELLVENCNVCKSKTKKSDDLFSKVSSVHITVMVDKRECPDFRFLLIYVDKATGFVVIRPLQNKSTLEITMELFKILMQFGPPQKLCLCGYNRELNEKIAESLEQLCPMFNFTVEFEPEDFALSANVVEKLEQWSNQTGSTAWEIGCFIVQRNMNIETKVKTGEVKPITAETDLKHLDTPHSLFYRNLIKIDSTRQEPSNSKDTQESNSHKKQDTQESTLQREAEKETGNLIVDDNASEIVQLSIPSPENYEDDTLSQLGFDELNMAESINELNEFKVGNRASPGMDCDPFLKAEIEAEIAKEIEELDDECEEVLEQKVNKSQ